MLRLARRQPSAILVAAQLAALLVYPFTEGSHVGRAMFSAFGIAFLGLVLFAVRGSQARTSSGVALAIPATVLLVIQASPGATICCRTPPRSRRCSTSTRRWR